MKKNSYYDLVAFCGYNVNVNPNVNALLDLSVVHGASHVAQMDNDRSQIWSPCRVDLEHDLPGVP